MVRNIVGTLVDIGRGRRPVEEMGAILASRDRAQASATAPAHGLTLWSVEYKVPVSRRRSDCRAQTVTASSLQEPGDPAELR